MAGKKQEERRLRRRAARRARLGAGAMPDPLQSMPGLGDLMLVLAVGFLLAVVVRWNVPIADTADTSEAVKAAESKGNLDTSGSLSSHQQEGDPAVSFTGDELEQTKNLPENARQVGKVYYDEKTDTYYILEDPIIEDPTIENPLIEDPAPANTPQKQH